MIDKNIIKKRLGLIVAAIILLSTIIVSLAVSGNDVCATDCMSSWNIVQTIENATSSNAYKYGVKDDMGNSMDTLR